MELDRTSNRQSSLSLYRCDDLQSDRLHATQRHETELASVKMSFESQLSANRGVIAALQSALESRDVEVERLQNELSAAHSKMVGPEGAMQMTPRAEPDEDGEQPTSVSKMFK